MYHLLVVYLFKQFKQIEIMTKIRKDHNGEMKLGNTPFIVLAIIVVAITILTFLTDK